MYDYIYTNLSIAYDIIRYIHQLYLKYNQIVRFKSFNPFGRGIDTTYRIIQTTQLVPPILMAKVKIIDNHIYLLPYRIITAIGIWTFISEPQYIKNDYNFSIELCKTLNLKYILPYTQSDEYGLMEPMFIIREYNINLYHDIFKIKYMNLDTIINIYTFDDVFKNISDLFSDFTYGPDVIDYIFEKFIERLMLFDVIDDKKNYFMEYKQSKNKNEYMNKIKEIYSNKREYYNKRDLSTLFYLTIII